MSCDYVDSCFVQVITRALLLFAKYLQKYANFIYRTSLLESPPHKYFLNSSIPGSPSTDPSKTPKQTSNQNTCTARLGIKHHQASRWHPTSCTPAISYFSVPPFAARTFSSSLTHKQLPATNISRTAKPQLPDTKTG